MEFEKDTCELIKERERAIKQIVWLLLQDLGEKERGVVVTNIAIEILQETIGRIKGLLNLHKILNLNMGEKNNESIKSL